MTNQRRVSRNLPVVELDAIVFVTSYYDGPLEGLVMVSDRLHYFALSPEAADGGGPWLVFPLTDAEVARELRCKQLFERHVGTWWSRDVPPGQRRVDTCEGSQSYEEAVAAEFGDLREADTAVGYQGRDPVAVIAAS